MCCTRRETAIPRRSRATCHARSHISDDRRFGAVDSAAESHSDAGAVRRFSVHGGGLTQGIAVLRPDSHHIHAGKIPARLYVFATGLCLDCAKTLLCN